MALKPAGRNFTLRLGVELRLNALDGILYSIYSSVKASQYHLMLKKPKDGCVLPKIEEKAADFGKSISSAINWSRTDPVKGLGLAVASGIDLRSYLSSSAKEHLVLSDKGAAEADKALSTMSWLKKPFEETGALRSMDAFQGTLNTLASVATIADTATALLGAADTIRSGSSLMHSVQTQSIFSQKDALDLSRRFGSPYLGSVASVFSLEKGYSQLAVGTAGFLKLTTESAIPSLSLKTVNTLHAGVTSLSIATRDAWSGLELSEYSTIALKGEWLKRPASELYAATQVAAAISLPAAAQPREDTELEAVLIADNGSFEGRIRSLNPDLLPVYLGGIEALERGGSDWQRHAMGSFRELATQVLHHLAPDEAVREFTSAPEHYHDGRPTRAARLNCIFANVAKGSLIEFYRADTRAAIELFDMLNSGTHQLGQKASVMQVRYLKSRLVGLISSMLEARGY